MKRKFITAALCFVMATLPIREARSQMAPAIFCLAITAAIVAGGCAVYVKTCKPRWYCVHDPEDDAKGRWCVAMTKKEIAINGWLLCDQGYYPSFQNCDLNCNNSNQVHTAASAPWPTPLTIHIERSTNLVDWVEAGTFVGEVQEIYWSETNTCPVACFYRARY